MAKPNQKFIREKLEEFAIAQGKCDSLRAQRDAAIAPHREKYERTILRVGKEFDEQILMTQADLQRINFEIETEIRKGFDAATNGFAVKKVETDLAFVEVNTREERELSAEDWLREVPKSEQTNAFFGTLKVLITKADKFRSDIVTKLAQMKRTHTVTVRLK